MPFDESPESGRIAPGGGDHEVFVGRHTQPLFRGKATHREYEAPRRPFTSLVPGRKESGPRWPGLCPAGLTQPAPRHGPSGDPRPPLLVSNCPLSDESAFPQSRGTLWRLCLGGAIAGRFRTLLAVFASGLKKSQLLARAVAAAMRAQQLEKRLLLWRRQHRLSR